MSQKDTNCRLPGQPLDFSCSPRRYSGGDFHQEGVEAFFYDGPSWRGRPTRVFAWYGRPAEASPAHPVPGVVLIHGGGATALADWVKLWNARGFAALAMDTCGGVPGWSPNPYFQQEWPRHPHSGPAGWGRFEESGLPVQEQWMYHAVAAVGNARTLLASFPEVDGTKIGWTGISWGAVIGCLAAGLVPEFRFAIPVYGCGLWNMPESSLLGEKETREQRDAWFRLWDPAHYLPAATTPFLWLTDAEDAPFPLSAWSRSSSLPAGPRFRSLRIDYPHDHTRCWSARTIFDFAESVLAETPLPRWEAPQRTGRTISARLSLAGRKITTAELCFTRGGGCWQDRRWHPVPAKAGSDLVEAEVPPLTQAAFLRIQDDHGSLWTSDVLAWESDSSS